MKKNNVKEQMHRGITWVKEHKVKTAEILALFLVLVAVIVIAGTAGTKPKREAGTKEDQRTVATVSKSSGEIMTLEREKQSVASTTGNDEANTKNDDANAEKKIKEQKKTEDKKKPDEVTGTETQKEDDRKGDRKQQDKKEESSTASSSKQVEAGNRPVERPVIEARSQETSHQHNWQPVTSVVHHDAVTHVVHHAATYRTVHHEAETEEQPVYDCRTYCNTCGADITDNVVNHFVFNDCDGGYYNASIQIGTNVVTIQPAYDEEVLATAAYDETVVDQAAYDEVITKGYRCAECGATK